MKITLIGFGNMAKAVASGVKNAEITASAPSLEEGVTPQGIHTTSSNPLAVGHAQVIILAVKPDKVFEVCREIAGAMPRNALVISLAAGISLKKIASNLPTHQGIVRAMPNVGAQLGFSATPLIANDKVSVQQKLWAETLFSSLGIVHWVNKEDDINKLTALSGSGPAYFFLFMDALVKAALSLGLEPELAHRFTLMTAKGAIKLAEQGNLSFTTLKEKVTSPKGTTAAALAVLQEKHFDEIMEVAVKAAYHRALELEQGN